MPKNLLQDMVKTKSARRVTRASQKVNDVNQEISLTELRKKEKDPTWHTLWPVAVVSVVFLVFALSYLFSKATIIINPKIQNLTLNENLSASKDAGTTALAFNLVEISGEETKTIQASGEQDILKKATGKVKIFNTFGSGTQRLDINTRLEGSNGKIYKTEKQVVVPGMKDGTPGSVEVGIYGSEGGEEYNSGPLDFTILGFKGGPKYAKFYGRSEGAITGGLQGKFYVISENEKIIALSELKIALREKLSRQATDQIPDGFILFKDATFLKINDSVSDLISSKENILPVTLSGTLYGLLFNETDLVKKITDNNIKEYDGSSVVFIPDLRDLTFSLSAQAGFSDKDSTPFRDIKNINFNLSGDIKIIWEIDARELADDLLGKQKKDFNQILSQYPNIDTADVNIRPFWKRSFPEKTKDIEVIVNYPE